MLPNGASASFPSGSSRDSPAAAGKRTARDVGEEELDGVGQKRFQRWPNAVAPTTSRSSPAVLATTNERERREARMSGRLLGMVCVQWRARRGFL
jgi:hypothetical protein